MPTSKTKPAASPRKATAKSERAAAAKQAAEARRALKLHIIAERRAKQAKMSKTDYIKAIVAGKFRPITAEDIANEPTPEPPAE